MTLRHMLALACAAILCLPSAMAQSGDPPAAARSMRLIVPFAPGGSADTLARLLAEPLGRRLGHAVTVENRAGAGGLIANEACARAAPDGLTLCLGSAATHSVLPLQMPGRIGAEPSGFTPITRIGDELSVMVVSRAHPAADLQGFLDWARRQPLVVFGVGGASSAGTLMMQQIGRATGLALEPVFYRGGSQTQTAVIAGEVPVGVGLVSSFAGALRGGEVRARAEALGVDIDLLGPLDFAAWLRGIAPAWAELLALSAAPAAPPGRAAEADATRPSP